jgi:hypothetical protein
MLPGGEGRVVKQTILMWAIAVAAFAQDVRAPAPEAVPEAVPVEETTVEPIVPPFVAPGTLLLVPAMTPVYVQIDEELTSKTSKPGDHFHLSIAEDVRVGGAVVIPAGSAGLGEVVHAAKSGGGGKAGELILAARFVTVGQQEVKLRSFVIGGHGKDHTDDALAVAVAIGAFAMFVHGGQLVIPPGTSASAKTAIDIQLPALGAEPAAPLPIDTTTEGEEQHEKQTS